MAFYTPQQSQTTCVNHSLVTGFAIAKISFNILTWRTEVQGFLTLCTKSLPLVSQGLSQSKGLLLSEKDV